MNAWQLSWTSERSIIARLPESIAQSDAASQLAGWISSHYSGRFRSVIPSANGVLIEFNTLHCSLSDSWSVVVQMIESFERDRFHGQPEGASHAREILIPVCYANKFAPDLKQVAHQLNLQPERLIELHTAAVYKVDAMGFMPGFGYLRSLHNLLRLPRMETPRTQVPAGSVAIAEDMTSVYPHQSAGGWHLIGRTPLQLFNPNQKEPSLLRVGDTVRFNQITYDEFNIYEEAQPGEDD
jgi:inhibitor of KinA